ncbi:MAG: hypothetical protein Q8L04_11015 [Ignavibacteria bacterium]|nr:hypothetical protein [Ignavibacteria bacterium]
MKNFEDITTNIPQGEHSMKQILYFFSLIVVFAVYTNAQTVGLGNTDPSVFADYRLPDISYHSLWLGSDFTFYSHKTITKDDYNPNRYQYRGDLSLSPSYSYLKQTDESKLKIFSGVFGGYHNSYDVNDGNSNYRADKTKRLRYDLNFVSIMDYYNHFESSNYYYSIGTFSGVYLDENKYKDAYESGSKRQIYNFYSGIGWGKIRMVTPVISALRLQERLKQINILNQDLSRNTIEKVAKEFSNASSLSEVHDRSDKYLWDRIENALSDDGVSLEGVNQYGSSYIREIPNEVRFERYEGIQVGIRFGLEYDNDFWKNEKNRQLRETFYLKGNPYLNYSHQLDLYSQVSFNLSLSLGPSINKNNDIKQSYLLTYDIGYDRELTDRFVFSARHKMWLNYRNKQEKERGINTSLNISGSYFLEDNIAINASYNLWYNDPGSYSEWMAIDIQNDLKVGVTYYFDRGIIIK